MATDIPRGSGLGERWRRVSSSGWVVEVRGVKVDEYVSYFVSGGRGLMEAREVGSRTSFRWSLSWDMNWGGKFLSSRPDLGWRQRRKGRERALARNVLGGNQWGKLLRGSSPLAPKPRPTSHFPTYTNKRTTTNLALNFINHLTYSFHPSFFYSRRQPKWNTRIWQLIWIFS